MVEPRRLMVSRETGSRPLGVIFTVRSEVFICGDTEVMVPWRIVPVQRGGRVSGDTIFFFLCPPSSNDGLSRSWSFGTGRN